jgi:hypothetical protein
MMTHDELLKVVNWSVELAEAQYLQELLNQMKALRAVVELHKPITTPNNFSYCPECQYGHARGVYPCPTIQAIEKELS